MFCPLNHSIDKKCIMDSKTSVTFSNLVISGGSMKVLGCIGCITYLEEVGIIKNIKNFVGTSAGSILCLLVVLGYKSREIVELLISILTNDDIASFDVEEALSIFETYGLSSGKALYNVVQTAIERKTGKKDTTFIELAKATGKNLVVCVANLSDNKEEYWSLDTVPNMSVAFAIRTSCSLPILFSPSQYKGKLYIDGGLYNNFPIDYFANTPVKDVIGIRVLSTKPNAAKDFLSYVYLILSLTMLRLERSFPNDLSNNVVSLELRDDSWVSINEFKIKLPEKQLKQYILKGYDEMQKCMKQYIL